jgi:glycosyltransferase involved in cell wall biosynthesis
LRYKVALRSETRERLSAKIKKADIVVGIPCFHDENTIGHVIQAAADGLAKYFPGLRKVILVADGGSLDDTREIVLAAPVPRGVEKMVFIYRGLPGKGTAFRSIFEASKLLRAKVVVTLDSDLRSVVPLWIKLMVHPVLSGKYDYVTPYYLRHKYDGTISNNITYPLLRTLYGLRIRQPMGGDFALSGDLAKAYLVEDVWMGDVARFGIDSWMTTEAINKGYRICQVNLGTKIHNPKEPSLTLGPMFREVVGTLFGLMEKYEYNWIQVKGSKPVKTYDHYHSTEPEALLVDIEGMIGQLQHNYSDCHDIWKEIMSEDNFQGLSKLARIKKMKDFKFPLDLWARIVYDFACAYHEKELPAKEIIDFFTPLYFAKTGSFAQETLDLSSKDSERIVEKQALAFEKEKPYLLERWSEV